MKMSTQVDLFTDVQPTSFSPAIAKPIVSRSTFYQGDCLVEMDKIADKSVDMILCDLPYGTTDCKWDSVIAFEPLWKHYERIIKDNGAIALTGSPPFTSALIMSNINWFKYSLVWDKVAVTNPMLAKKQPMRCHEDIVVFYKKQPTYNPQMRIGKIWSRAGKKEHKTDTLGQSTLFSTGSDTSEMKYPKSIITFSNADKTKNQHPTQKPIELMEYLIKTYTNEGETVLDNCMGSGTTGVACKKSNRHFIGIEKDEKYFEVAVDRVTSYCH
jgi:site-specific DNA-methyltransferase (adenine-specific)